MLKLQLSEAEGLEKHKAESSPAKNSGRNGRRSETTMTLSQFLAANGGRTEG